VTAPAVHIVFELESRPKVVCDWLDSHDEERVRDWLEAHPAYVDLVNRALELAREKRAA
jgi:hypothetical protein